MTIPAGSTEPRRVRGATRALGRVGAVCLLVLGVAMMALGSGLLGSADEPSASARTAASPTPAPVLEMREAEELQAAEERRTRRKPSLLRAAAPPTGLTVPALDLKARVAPIEVTPDGNLDPPGDLSAVGWWQRSAPAGARSGQTVLTGHSVHTGGGVMDELEDLERGDRVKVFHDGALMPYAVTEVQIWSKAELAEQAEAIFAQDREQGRLVLITCEDWNGSAWDSNVVVFARPLRR